jgi:hypothetical protein
MMCWCLLGACALYATATQAQSKFPTIYPKVYEVNCAGKTCGAATCTSTGPFVDLASTGQMQFNSATTGVGSAQISVGDGATNLPFHTAAFTFTAVNGTGVANPAGSCTGAACIPAGCATITETLPLLGKTSHETICFSHNGGEFSGIGTDTNAGGFVCHGNALTQ